MVNNRNKTVQCRLNDEELLKLEDAAKMNSMTKSELLRKSVNFYLDTFDREIAKYKPFIFDNIKTMQLLLESTEFHKEELKREVERLLWAIDR